MSQNVPNCPTGQKILGVIALEDVVEFYNRGGGTNPNLDPAMKPLDLSREELADLVAFLKAL